MTRIAAVQFESRLLDPEANLVRILDQIQDLGRRGVELTVFPECALTGYALSAEEAASVAEAIPGACTDRLSQACRAAGMQAVVGTIERDPDGRLYNTAVLAGPQGLIARYRKTHLIFLGVDRFLTPGQALTEPQPTPLGRLGMLICYDLRFPEPARVLSLAGAQAILLPTAWPMAASLYPDYIVRARASENGVFIIAADHVGEERGARYLGRSMIAGPEGEILAEAGTEHEQVLLADIDLARSDRKHRAIIPGEYEIDLVRDRRPDLYGPIAQGGPTSG